MTRKIATRRRNVTLPRSVKRLFPQVIAAYDADKPVEISVNKKDCTDATALDPTECALAKAAKRELHADAVIIGMTSSYIIKDKTAIRFQTPQSVQREIVSFDRHKDFAPGDYYLTPKSKNARLGSGHATKAKNNHGNPNNKTAKRKMHHSARIRVLDKGYQMND